MLMEDVVLYLKQFLQSEKYWGVSIMDGGDDLQVREIKGIIPNQKKEDNNDKYIYLRTLVE